MEHATEPVSRLWSLPQEILDEIFDFAFPADPDLKLATKSSWESGELFKHKRDETHLIRKYAPKVNSFLVSKRFLLAAARAYSRNQLWHQNMMNSLHILSIPLLLNSARSIGTMLHCGSELEELAHTPGIKTLAVQLDESVFDISNGDSDTLQPKYAWREAFAHEECIQLPIMQRVARLKYIQHLIILPSYCVYTTTEAQRQIYDKNIECLEKAMQKTLDGVKTAYSADQDESLSCSPLYENSRVCTLCPELHHPDQYMKWDAQRTKEEEEKVLSTLQEAGLATWNETNEMPKSEEEIKMLISLRPEMVTNWILRGNEDGNKLEQCEKESGNKLKQRERRRHRWRKAIKIIFRR